MNARGSTIGSALFLLLGLYGIVRGSPGEGEDGMFFYGGIIFVVIFLPLTIYYAVQAQRGK